MSRHDPHPAPLVSDPAMMTDLVQPGCKAPAQPPQPCQPLLDLVRPEQRSFIDWLRHHLGRTTP